MITNQILLSTIEGLKAITNENLCVMDTEGRKLASTFEEDRVQPEDVISFVRSQADSQEISEYQFFKIYDEDSQLEYVLVVDGGSDASFMVGKIAAFQIRGLLSAYKEHYDKDNFIKNLLLDNLLLVDIYNRAKKLHLETDVRRMVLLVETGVEKNSGVLEKLREQYGSKAGDFVTAVDEKDIIIVREIPDRTKEDSEQKTAQSVLSMLEKMGCTQARISYGTSVSSLKDVSHSYKEAKMALDVGKIFFENRSIIAYSSLGIGRLIYQLPIPLCKMFIKEIFQGKSPEDFDEETLVTIDKFFENSLNVSETSRQLFIHR
ncbi:MAG: PucR family transcriptional regulator, partial [Lachnospiraceae bacterium]|nr:PucR family transcriptional regulator [Lachnospiraceae bacterium]